MHPARSRSRQHAQVTDSGSPVGAVEDPHAGPRQRADLPRSLAGAGGQRGSGERQHHPVVSSPWLVGTNRHSLLLPLLPTRPLLLLPLQGLVHMARTEGMRGMMKGNFANCIRITPNSAVKFFTYEQITRCAVSCLTPRPRQSWVAICLGRSPAERQHLCNGVGLGLGLAAASGGD